MGEAEEFLGKPIADEKEAKPWEILGFYRLKSWSSARPETELKRSGHSARIDPY